jgi:t-SNARE complex subunit (syntaxin)
MIIRFKQEKVARNTKYDSCECFLVVVVVVVVIVVVVVVVYDGSGGSGGEWNVGF